SPVRYRAAVWFEVRNSADKRPSRVFRRVVSGSTRRLRPIRAPGSRSIENKSVAPSIAAKTTANVAPAVRRSTANRRQDDSPALPGVVIGTPLIDPGVLKLREATSPDNPARADSHVGLRSTGHGNSADACSQAPVRWAYIQR